MISIQSTTHLLLGTWFLFAHPAEARGLSSYAFFSHDSDDDTLLLKSFMPVQQGGLGCFTGYYPIAGGGYVSGNNNYGDKEKAQFFSLKAMEKAPPAMLNGVLARIAYKTVAQADATARILVYRPDSSGFSPGELMGASDPVLLSELPTDGQLSSFLFGQGLPLNGDSFFVSLELPTQAGDTLVLQSTNDLCRQQPHWSWERWADGTWHSLLNSWMLDIDLALFPFGMFNPLIGMEEAGLSVAFHVSYLPAAAAAFVHLQQPEPNAEVCVLDAAGRSVVPEQRLTGPLHVIDCRALPNGLYLVRLRSAASQQCRPLVILR
ncbi:MAG: hypothetical protein RMK52_09685 [Chitinophagales bacterium]|nr:hypothetical protein [Chitinophagales bacterium]MDW8394497.1 hypothetical protein [Chitinophagales bacterium]